MTPQVLSQDLSISHDFLDQDSQETHALAKKKFDKGIYINHFCLYVYFFINLLMMIDKRI